MVSLPSSIVAALPVSMKIMEHILAAEKLFPQLEKELNKAEKAGSIAMARAFVVLHRMRKRIHTEDSNADSVFRPLMTMFNRYNKEVIPHMFEVEGVTNVPLAEGFRVGVSNPFYASIKPDMKTAAYAWLQQNGLADIIQSTVNASTLSAALKVMLEEHNKEAPDEMFTAAYVPATSVTKT